MCSGHGNGQSGSVSGVSYLRGSGRTAHEARVMLTSLAPPHSLLKMDHPLQVSDGGFDSAHNAQITWRHLLQQSSEWSGAGSAAPHPLHTGLFADVFGASESEHMILIIYGESV